MKKFMTFSEAFRRQNPTVETLEKNYRNFKYIAWAGIATILYSVGFEVYLLLSGNFGITPLVSAGLGVAIWFRGAALAYGISNKTLNVKEIWSDYKYWLVPSVNISVLYKDEINGYLCNPVEKIERTPIQIKNRESIIFSDRKARIVKINKKGGDK
ncbi:hypothetical protein IGC24_004598 [Salmonella enterica subsp. enterica serovar Heidelberg]|uniref:hypothetical protein n=1 Tax=Salmonella enterica TaxID=28901 RepID=UPI0009AA8A8C|nr:hypothetical protein [Salmonella enterica]ECT1760973.1 hypothetical protein [Salmonella enterica subsp. enterica serovar Heidelberg]EED8223119.1 hypothetical protein [Salmonella enterica subsp. enterica serovar Braenderup]EEM4056889.1 hypothetical protein [Salmonella enterica subsp. enterica serovar Kentucky]EAU2192121.1 hypothetical protein [Salmonella enterica]EAX1365481.1 hypothetical protein [Salmonella enterica]